MMMMMTMMMMMMMMMLQQVVGPSLSVTLMYRGHIRLVVSSNADTRLVSLGSSHLGAPTSAIKSKGNTPNIRPFSTENCDISETGKHRTKVTIITNRKSYTRFRLVPKSMTLNGRYALQQNMHFSEPIRKIWLKMKIDEHYQRRRLALTLVSRNISFMRIFTGVPWSEGVKRQLGNGKRRLSVLSDYSDGHKHRPT